MEGNNDYESLLKSYFDSCDVSGSGYLSPTELKKLCNELNLNVSLL